MNRSALPVVSLLLLLAAAPSTAEQPFTARDLVALDRVSDPRISPDGARVAFVVRETDMEANRGRTDLWLLDLDDSEPRRLTTHEASDSSPRWSVDGDALYFLSTRSGSSQVWRLPLSGGEARQVTDLPVDVGNFLLSPRGTHLALTMEVFPDCDDLECTRNRRDEQSSSKRTGRDYERLFIRQWDSWHDGTRSMLFALALDEAGDATGEPRALSAGLAANVPSRPFGGAEEISFTRDGQALIFTARIADAREAWSTNFDLYRVQIDGSSAPVNLTADNKAWDTMPVVSPDGNSLAYLAMKRPDFEADRFRIVLLDMKSGTRRVLTEDWDRSPRSLAFSTDGQRLFTVTNHLGNRPLWSIDVRSGESRMLTARGSVSAVSAGSRNLVVAMDSFAAPADLYRLGAGGGALKQITHFNRARLSNRAMGEFEQFSFAGWNEETVHGYVFKPANHEAGARYPVAFLIHGGPQGSFVSNFHYRWNPQTYAGAGYAVVIVDFHGSTGYGQAFTDSITGDWGGKPLEDLQKGLAYALESYPWLDGDRVCALGASYGGYMVNWIAGNWPERFECLVNHDGIFDQRMMYYATEELWFPEWEQGGPYYLDSSLYERHNPANFVVDWKTPMLVIHGALDYRVPDTQGIATFTALQRRGIPSRFLYFPDENHWVLKPANSIQWHETVEDWLAKWLR